MDDPEIQQPIPAEYSMTTTVDVVVPIPPRPLPDNPVIPPIAPENEKNMWYNQLFRRQILLKMRLEIQYYHSIMDTSGTNTTIPITCLSMGVYMINSGEVGDHQVIQYQRMET